MAETSLAVGTTGLALGTVQASISILKFLSRLITGMEDFGDDTPTFQARLLCEVARLEYLSQYLKEGADGSTPKFETLPSPVQLAIAGLVEELELRFLAYSHLVTQNRDVTVLGKRKENVKGINKVTISGQPKRGIFQKKRIIQLLSDTEEWNSRLKNLLLCGLCFGSTSPPATPAEAQAVDNGPELSGVLSLRALIKAQDENNTSARRDWTSELSFGLVLPSDSKIGTLVRRSGPGNAGGSSADRTRVFVEVKEFALRRRALEPSEQVKQRVNRLADILAQAAGPKAGFRTLPCIAVVRISAPVTGYAFAFDLPEAKFGKGSKGPHTLLRALEQRRVGGGADGEPRRPTLDERFAIARALAQTLFELHSVDWVHKSIRSENVLLPWRSASKKDSGAVECDYTGPILVGFEFSREEGDISTSEQDTLLHRNVYRHPDRQGPPDVRFAARHDIYALGVVLLEIGLWQPATKLDARFLESDMEAEDIMQTLRDHARIRLPHHMGVGYADAVMACLGGQLLVAEGEGEEGRSADAKTKAVGEEQRMQNSLAFLELVVERISNGVILGK